MTKHTHLCLCGLEFSCVINILPVKGGRIRCERVYESVCPSCLESMTANGSPEDLQSMAGAGEWDPLLQRRVRRRIE